MTVGAYLVLFYFEIKSQYVALASMELPMWIKLTSNLEEICFCFLSAGIKGVHHHVQFPPLRFILEYINVCIPI